jgi:hypothetical protein
MENKDNEFKVLGVVTKSEEENIKLSLSIACIQLQVKSLEEVCMDTKLQVKLKMNEFETK